MFTNINKGYYFTTTQETTQLELATVAGQILHDKGLIKSAQPKQVSVDQVRSMLASSWEYLGLYTFACNTRASSDRARKYLDYQPDEPTVFECMEHDLMACLEGK